ncbi:unnamed protein product [Cuscuta campestris]|uniref:Zinc knuckle CX2CX4HX4C domain-containing protein n=1 Tax=Cuscuta campestris TaxID=132261 RepID=A0A484MY37_9ASTE|nr:unnamed protein product [Cuscuta campestris]
MDKATWEGIKPNHAQVRVEMDLLMPLVSKVFIGTSVEEGKEDQGFFQLVEYEKIPYYCIHCRRQGHSFEKCKLLEEYHAFEARRKGKELAHDTRQKRERSKSRGREEPKKVYIAKTTTQVAELTPGETAAIPPPHSAISVPNPMQIGPKTLTHVGSKNPTAEPLAINLQNPPHATQTPSAIETHTPAHQIPSHENPLPEASTAKNFESDGQRAAALGDDNLRQVTLAVSRLDGRCSTTAPIEDGDTI